MGVLTHATPHADLSSVAEVAISISEVSVAIKEAMLIVASKFQFLLVTDAGSILYLLPLEIFCKQLEATGYLLTADQRQEERCYALPLIDN